VVDENLLLGAVGRWPVFEVRDRGGVAVGVIM